MTRVGWRILQLNGEEWSIQGKKEELNILKWSISQHESRTEEYKINLEYNSVDQSILELNSE